ncbi:protein HESO1-like [Durio zibethinus]|uniref:Protein HESO1-like n=1 Tax=Durio zibethinus TaxID=66656 RepID=A0A6P6AHB7_DURZI|nr:protein HESO1-like [Durio zibethinus]
MSESGSSAIKSRSDPRFEREKGRKKAPLCLKRKFVLSVMLAQMDLYTVVEPTLKEVLAVIKPLDEDRDTRLKIIGELSEVVQSMNSLTGATVKPFGSFLSDLFILRGDLDISVDLPHGSYVSSAGKKRKQDLLRELHEALRQKGGWSRLRLIPRAKVPILKVVSKWQNISCDISIDNLEGQIKSKFLLWLNGIDGRFRDMVLLVKEWAKTYGINNPRTRAFNSYSLTLLVIFHLQTCVPAILPPLKDIYPANLVDNLTGVKADAESIQQECASNIARFISGRTINQSSLSELFISFFKKYSDINLKASEMVICPFTGQWEYITSNTSWSTRTYPVFVEDPFEQEENAARRVVRQEQLIKISEAFKRNHGLLNSTNLSRSTLLATLVGQRRAQFLIKPQVIHSSYNGGQYLNLYPQVHQDSLFANAAASVQEHKALNLTNAASSSGEDALNLRSAISISENKDGK